MPRSEFCTTASETNPSRRIHNDIRDSQFPESSQKTSAMHSERTAYIRSISKQQLVRSHISSRKLNPFFFSLLSLPGGDPTGVFFFHRQHSAIASRAILRGMNEALEGNLIGRESNVVPGRFGEPLQVAYAQYSPGGGCAAPRRPLFLCLHGWARMRPILPI